jgi:uncharacterized protein YqjF (DUF2071 family)/predicted DCC family thiol-disulfide oxidoreductase YuxK
MALPFLTAHWRNLIVINYEIDPSLLKPLLPLGTELDLFHNTALISVIAFNFERNKVFGVIPTVPVTQFEEINLRFYVRRKIGDEIRRGVVFVKEVVPSALIAATARILYNEPYEARPMGHSFKNFDEDGGGTLSYEMRVGNRTVSIAASTDGEHRALQTSSIEHFILEHYWGYTKQDDGTTSEYRVEHEPWRYWETIATDISGDLASLYPAVFKEALSQPPHSSFVARGSPVAVYAYQRFHPRYATSAFPRKDAHGYLLYDAHCGLCSRWISAMGQHLRHVGIEFAPLQSAWVYETLSLSTEQRAEEIRLILADGTLLTGGDVYIHILRCLWWCRPIGVLLSLPVLRWMTWRVYRLVNRNRFAISRACNLKPHHTESNPQ